MPFALLADEDRVAVEEQILWCVKLLPAHPIVATTSAAFHLQSEGASATSRLVTWRHNANFFWPWTPSWASWT